MADGGAISSENGYALESGAAIANARGAYGTLGFVGLRRDNGRAVIVTSYHVAFGRGAVAGEPVSILAHEDAARRIGRSAYGRNGIVRLGGDDFWVDCAVVDLDSGIVGRAVSEHDAGEADDEVPPLAVGDQLSAAGAATGVTRGVVVNVAFSDRILVGGRITVTPRQIVVRSAKPGGAFSAPGNSGAALRNQRGQIVGLLWGITPRGDGIASPIAPLLRLLHVRIGSAAAARDVSTLLGARADANLR